MSYDDVIPLIPLEAARSHTCIHVVAKMLLFMPAYDFRERGNRFLLILTENYAAMRKEEVPYLRDFGANKKAPLVIFGSSFPQDVEYTQICRNINKVAIKKAQIMHIKKYFCQ